MYEKVRVGAIYLKLALAALVGPGNKNSFKTPLTNDNPKAPALVYSSSLVSLKPAIVKSMLCCSAER